MDDSQDKTGLKGLEAVEDSAMVRRIMSRQTRPPGLIDMKHTQDHYSRLTEWPVQRHELLDQLKERYDLSPDESSTASNMIYTSPQGQQQDANESFREGARPTPSAGETFETPKKSTPAARAPQEKFRVSRKPNSTAGKLRQHDAPEDSSQAMESESRGQLNNSRRAEISDKAAPTVESLASSSEVVTDSTPTAQPTVLRLSRKKTGGPVQKISAPGMDERGSGTIADADNLHQPDWANDAETAQFPASMPVVSQGVDDKTSDSPANARASVRHVTSAAASQSSLALSSKQSALDRQSSTKETAPLLLRKSKADGPTPQTPDLGNASRASSVDAGARTSLMETRDESVAGERLRQPVATETKGAAIEGQAPETLPLLKAQPVAAQVQLKLADETTENVGPVSRAGAGANQSSTATAVEMRPASSRAQASGIVWRKRAGESSHQDASGSSGRSVYSSNSSSASASLPLTSGQVQRQATAPVQRQPGGDSHNSQSGSSDLVQRVGHEAGPGAAQAQAATEVDLERITEHVSRAIFRQLSIERERRGF